MNQANETRDKQKERLDQHSNERKFNENRLFVAIEPSSGFFFYSIIFTIFGLTAKTIAIPLLLFFKKFKMIVNALIRPEQFQKMDLYYYHIIERRFLASDIALDDEFLMFLKKFKNLTYLSISVMNLVTVGKVINVMPNLQELHISPTSFFPAGLNIGKIDPIISSATDHSKLSVLSFSISEQYFEICQTQITQRISPEQWSFTFNERDSNFVLNRIWSA